MGKHLAPELRSLVISSRKNGKSLRAISKELDLPKSTVQGICKHHLKTNCADIIPIVKIPRKLTETDEDFLVRENNKNPSLSWQELRDMLLEHTGTDVSRCTVRRFFYRHKQKNTSRSGGTWSAHKNVSVQRRDSKDSTDSCGLDSLIMPSVDQQSEMATMSTKPIEVFDTYKSSDQEEVSVVSDSIEVFDTYKRPDEEERDSDEESFHLRLEDDDVEACGPVNESVLDDEDQILDKFQKDLEKTGGDKCDEQATTTTRKRPAEDDAEEEIKTKSSKIEESTSKEDMEEQQESEAKAGPSSESCIEEEKGEEEESIDENNQKNGEEPATELSTTNKEEEDEPGEDKSQEEQIKLGEDVVENDEIAEGKDVSQSEQQQTHSALDEDVGGIDQIADDLLKPQSELDPSVEENTEIKLDDDSRMDVDVKTAEDTNTENVKSDENKIEHVQLEEAEKVNEDVKPDEGDKASEEDKLAEDDELPEHDKLSEDRLTGNDKLTEDDKTEGDRLAEGDKLAEDDKLVEHKLDDDDLTEEEKLDEEKFFVIDESTEDDRLPEDIMLGEDDIPIEDKEPNEDDKLIGDDKPAEDSNVNVDDKLNEDAHLDEDVLLEEPETASSTEEKPEACSQVNEETNEIVEDVKQEEEVIVSNSSTDDDNQLLVKDAEKIAVVNSSSSEDVSAETDKTDEKVDVVHTSETADVPVESDTAKISPAEETMEVASESGKNVDEKIEVDSEKQLEETLLNDDEDKLEDDDDSENKTAAVDEDKLLVDDTEGATADSQEPVATKDSTSEEKTESDTDKVPKSEVARDDVDAKSKVDDPDKPGDSEKTDGDVGKIETSLPPPPAPPKDDRQLDKCENSNDSSDDLMDISIIRDAAEDNAENAYNEAFPEEASDDSESREHSDKDDASCDKPEDDEEEEDEATAESDHRMDHFEAEEAKLLNEGECEDLLLSDGKADDSAVDSVKSSDNKDKVVETSASVSGDETITTRTEGAAEKVSTDEEPKADDEDKKLKDDVVADDKTAVGEDKENGSDNQRLSSGSLKRPASDNADDEVVAKKSKTSIAPAEDLDNSTSAADDGVDKDLNSECNISDVVNASETSINVDDSPLVLPADTVASISRTPPSPKNHVPESLLSLAKFMKNRKPSKLTKYDLEEFCLQKICEAVVHKSEMGEIHHQLKVQETLVDNMKREIQQLSKQVRDLEIVNKKLMNDLKQQQQTGVQKHLAPLKITRSVGLQVKFTPINPLDNKRKPSNCPVHPKNVPIPIGTGQLLPKGGQRVIQVNTPSSIRNLQQVEKSPNPKIDKVMQKLRRVAEGKPSASKTGSPRNRGLDDVITFSDSDSEISSDRSRVASPVRNEVRQNTSSSSSSIVQSQDSQENGRSDGRAQNIISHTNTAPHAQAIADYHPPIRPLKAPHKTKNITNTPPITNREVQQKQSLKSSTPILSQALLQQNRRATTASSSSSSDTAVTNRNNPQASGASAASPGGKNNNNNSSSSTVSSTSSSAKTASVQSSVIDLTDEDDSRKTTTSGSANTSTSTVKTTLATVPIVGGTTQQTRTTIATIQQQKSHAPLHQGVILRTTSGQPVRTINANQVRLTTTTSAQGKPIASVVTSSAGGVGGPQLMYVVQSGPGQNTGGNGAKAVVVNFQPTNGVLASTLNGSSVSVIPKASSTIQLKTVSSSPSKPIQSTGAGGAKAQRKHPAPLPYPPLVRLNADKNLKPIPPKPHLTIRKTETGIILQWRMPYELDLYEEIASYQLYAYQETNAPPSTDMWRRVGDVKALALPMACTLTQFADKNRYYFAVRPVDVHKRIGAFSNPEEISL